jgi:3-hydroxyacyl-[acyl-carrier-protein] dehydratase
MDPTTWLPHRPPFLLVDDVEITEAGVEAQGRWTPGPQHYAGHFPGRPILPGVLQVESIAQVGACALLASGVTGLPVFTGLEKVKWRRQVTPGDTLHITVRLDALRHRIGKGSGRAQVDGQLACQASLQFAVIDPDDIPG